MTKSLARLSAWLSTRGGTIATYLAVVALLIALGFPAVVRMIPLGNDISGTDPDDWTLYHSYALSVLNDGPSMPAVKGPYVRPGGFAYVYFIALNYRLFGVRSEVVYAVQTVLVSLAVLVYVFLARRRYPALVVLVYGVLLVFFVALDVWRNYQARLLSENLLVPLLALAVLAFETMARKPSWHTALLCGVVCGACFLVRPNTLLLAPAWAVLVLWSHRKQRSRAVIQAIALCVGASLVTGLLIVRNQAVGAGDHSSVVSPSRDWNVPATLADAPLFYVKKAIYLAGYLPILVREYQPRPHWLLVWPLAVLSVILKLRRRALDPLDQAIIVLLIVYYGPLLAVGDITNYGYRHLIAGMPLVLYLAQGCFAMRTASEREPATLPAATAAVR